MAAFWKNKVFRWFLCRYLYYNSRWTSKMMLYISQKNRTEICSYFSCHLYYFSFKVLASGHGELSGLLRFYQLECFINILLSRPKRVYGRLASNWIPSIIILSSIAFSPNSKSRSLCVGSLHIMVLHKPKIITNCRKLWKMSVCYTISDSLLIFLYLQIEIGTKTSTKIITGQLLKTMFFQAKHRK